MQSFKKIFIFLFLFSISYASCLSSQPQQIISTFSECELAEHFQSVEEQVKNRWHIFQNNREFKLFTPERSDDELKCEFENLQNTREFIWTTLGYNLAEHLVQADLIRAPGCVAFAYNNTVPYYNASTIYFGNRHYIASEGPRSKDIPKFFNLLTSHRVTHLLRLTDAYEGETKKCHPYWSGLINKSSDNKDYLNIPTEMGICSIRAFDMSHWRDNQGVDPCELLALVLQVRQELTDADGLLLVHCSAGVGRTGTFFAALAIVDAIDRGESFSIEEIVYRLSLQRVHSVGKFSQYITLHRLAENYLTQKSRRV